MTSCPSGSLIRFRRCVCSVGEYNDLKQLRIYALNVGADTLSPQIWSHWGRATASLSPDSSIVEVPGFDLELQPTQSMQNTVSSAL